MIVETKQCFVYNLNSINNNNNNSYSLDFWSGHFALIISSHHEELSKLWNYIDIFVQEVLTSQVAVKPAADQMSPPGTSTPKHETPRKIMKMSSPDYVIYTDTELDQVRKYYSEMQRCGRAHECTMSKELRCRLVRNTMTSMISILRANDMQDRCDAKYPSREEVSAMSKRLVEYYPMLQDKDSTKKPWVGFSSSLSKVVVIS